MSLQPKFPAEVYMSPRLNWVGIDGEIALNLGAGINPIQGAINHDLNPGPGINITFNVTDTLWPIKDAQFNKVLAFHLFEHIPIEKVLHVLNECARVLVPSGILIAEVPDIKGLCEDFLAGNMGSLRHIFSGDRMPGDQHRWGYTAESLAVLAYAAGFFQVLTTKGTDYHAGQMPTVRLEAVKSGR